MIEGIFFTLNLLMFPILILSILEFQRRHWGLGVVNPLSLNFVIFFPVEISKTILGPYFLLNDGLWGWYYQYALLMENISLFCTLIITVFFLLFLKQQSSFASIPLRIRSYNYSLTKLKFLEYSFIIVAFLFFYVMSSHSFSFFEWLLHPRTGYQLHRAGVGSLYAFSLTSLSIAFVIGVFRVSYMYQRIYKIFIYIFIVYFFGSKGFVISFFIFGAIVLWFFKYKRLNLFIALTGIIVTSAVVYNLFSSLGKMDLMVVFSYFDYYVNSAKFYKAIADGSLSLFNGKVFITDFWSLVPRGLYPDKPFVYGFLHVNEFFYPGAAALTNTPAFGGPTKPYADFGVLGVIIFSIFNFTYIFSLYLLNCLFRFGNIFKDRYRSSYIFLFILCFSPTYLVFIPGSIGFFMSIALLFFIILFARLTWNGRSHANMV